jgi:hypothetical protein
MIVFTSWPEEDVANGVFLQMEGIFQPLRVNPGKYTC